MKEILILQLRLSLSIMNDLQREEQNPEKYEVYENNKKKLQVQINELSDFPAHSPRVGSRMPSAPRSGGASAVLEPTSAGALRV